MRKWLSSQAEGLRKKRVWYWTRVALIIVAGLWVSDWIAKTGGWMKLRRSCSRALQDVAPIKPHPYATILVLIEDEEYWGLSEPFRSGPFTHRSPIRRDGLAKLVKAIAAEDPAVVALDLNLESPSPDGIPVDELEYAWETNELVKAIKEVPRRTSIVLPRTVREPWPGQYWENSAVYDGKDFGETKVSKGYISLPPAKDFRKIPLFTMTVQNGDSLGSLAQAIVRARNPRSSLDNKGVTLPTAAFVPLESFPHVSAGDVLKGEPGALNQLPHNIVIVGAHWHPDRDHGLLVDLHNSPLGMVPGALLHANYAEAILNERLYSEWQHNWLRVAEVTAAVLVALISALKTGFFVKLIAIALILLALVGMSILSLLAFASVFDSSILLIMVICHPVVERLVGKRETARA